MENQKKEVSYPGILFWSGSNFDVIRNPERMTNWIGWKKGNPYSKVRMYDSSGLLWENVSCEPQEFNFFQKLTNWSRIISRNRSGGMYQAARGIDSFEELGWGSREGGEVP